MTDGWVLAYALGTTSSTSMAAVLPSTAKTLEGAIGRFLVAIMVSSAHHAEAFIADPEYALFSQRGGGESRFQLIDD